MGGMSAFLHSLAIVSSAQVEMAVDASLADARFVGIGTEEFSWRSLRSRGGGVAGEARPGGVKVSSG